MDGVPADAPQLHFNYTTTNIYYQFSDDFSVKRKPLIEIPSICSILNIRPQDRIKDSLLVSEI